MSVLSWRLIPFDVIELLELAWIDLPELNANLAGSIHEDFVQIPTGPCDNDILSYAFVFDCV